MLDNQYHYSCPKCGDWPVEASSGLDGVILSCDNCDSKDLKEHFSKYSNNTFNLGEGIVRPIEILAKSSDPEIQDSGSFNAQFNREIEYLAEMVKPGTLLPGIFRSYLAGSRPISVVDGIVGFPNLLNTYRELLKMQTLIVGFHGRGIAARYVYSQEFGYESELSVIGLEVLGTFHLSAIAAPDEPFVQLRLAKHEPNLVILGDVLATYIGATFAVKILSGNGLRGVAYACTMKIKERMTIDQLNEEVK